MKHWLLRWKYRLMMFRDAGKELNRRTTVQNELYACASGKRPLPDAAKCRELANKLSF